MKIVFTDGPLEGEIEHELPVEIGKTWTVPIAGVQSDHPLSRGVWYWHWTGCSIYAEYKAIRFVPGEDSEDCRQYMKFVGVYSRAKVTRKQ